MIHKNETSQNNESRRRPGGYRRGVQAFRCRENSARRPLRALDCLESILRVYEGCDRAYLGEIEGANILEIHRRSGKLSYLSYPEFEKDPHPALNRCVRLSLRTRQLDSTDYSKSTNPPETPSPPGQ